MTMSDLVAALPASTVDEAGLAGEWELVYSDVELFRSSPFFLAIEVMRHPAKGAAVACCLPYTVAIPPSPVHSRHSSVPPTTAGCARQLARHPSAGQVARVDGPHAEVGALLQAPPAAGGKPTAPSHAPTASSAAATATTAATARVATAPTRQVLSWGTSTVGRIAQRLDFEEGLLESSFDTIIFGLTVVPLLGWGKLLPTFGGRVLTEADGLKLEGDELVMELQRTKVVTPPRGRP